ncbi:MAG: hypothetical protein KTR25_06580, partial [Myxococcales bacterium]|nr:hypothetical protein [Myxococcales bacterium]
MPAGLDQQAARTAKKSAQNEGIQQRPSPVLQRHSRAARTHHLYFTSLTATRIHYPYNISFRRKQHTSSILHITNRSPQTSSVIHITNSSLHRSSVIHITNSSLHPSSVVYITT